MGLDTIKLAVGMALAYVSWKHKSFDLIADLFNG